MKIKSIEQYGILQVYNTNVENNLNYISENGVIHKNCVVDSDFQGEVFINLSNIGNYYQELNPGDKLIQLILLPAPQIDLEEKEVSHLYDTTTDRGEGGFGSTDKDINEINFLVKTI